MYTCCVHQNKLMNTYICICMSIQMNNTFIHLYDVYYSLIFICSYISPPDLGGRFATCWPGGDVCQQIAKYQFRSIIYIKTT